MTEGSDGRVSTSHLPPAVSEGAPHRAPSKDRGFFFQAEAGIRYVAVTGVQTCALPISGALARVKDRKILLQIPVLHAGEGTRATDCCPPCLPTPHISCYMIAVGGAGSLGSPAAVSGNPIIKTARRNITIIPPKR